MTGYLKQAFLAAALLFAQGTLPVRAADPMPPAQNDGFGATLWMQTSVEYKAAALGAYALARIRLDAGKTVQTLDH